ncbi:DUF3034 family protein [Novosphingobium cyanobacteriorum]|uniref:DUF3034 family protein n=1 Tax=Novosphingobium cyanobacteriorum TaxID=3024215 RepID=A0ABT6CKL6_9SPHN|nr:DUF3034 family protein [Novosphingobium cyanobacteriorum]MDF8334469.1 DUF3034 family protein [Novosphingobium cyanobacteriorum]
MATILTTGRRRAATRWSLAGLLALGTPLASPAQADETFDDAKLLLTNGVTSVEGASGGGLASWSTIAGRGTERAIGVSAHVTAIALPDYGWQSHGVSVGIHDRLELSYARQNFDTRKVGAALGLGHGFKFNQDIFSAKLRLAGDLVYGPQWLPAIAVGVQHKRNLDGAIVRAVGARSAQGTDFTLSASKLFLSRSVLVNATARLTKANQFGLLGFGGDKHGKHSLQVEGTLAYQLSRRLAVGGEYRTKPDNLGIAREDDALDMFVAWAPVRNLTVTGAYVDVGSIATFGGQRGGLVQLQLAF